MPELSTPIRCPSRKFYPVLFTLVVACNLAGETLSILWIQQRDGKVPARDVEAASAAEFHDKDGKLMKAGGMPIKLKVYANSQGGMP